MCTIVTGLFDIKRNSMDGRTWEDYLNWFEKTLSLNCKMVIFVEPKLLNFVKEKRKSFPTKIISKNIEDLEYFKYKNIMDKILKSDEYLKKIKDSNRIECKYSLYSIIQYSKFEFIEKVSMDNPFNDDYFIWMDAGLSRFFDDLNLNNLYPAKNFKNLIKNYKDKTLIQTFCSYYPDLFYSKNLSKEYLLDNRSFVMGGMFGSGIQSIKNLKISVDVLFNNMLEENIVNNEQIALGYLFKNNPELFVNFINDSTKHRAYEIIQKMGQ